MGLQCEEAHHKDIQHIEVKKVVDIEECDREKCRHPSESGNPSTTQLCLDLICNSGCSSYKGRYNVDLHYRARRWLTLADPLQTSG
jgi:hypothetical protein